MIARSAPEWYDTTSYRRPLKRQGVLTPANEWCREQCIEILSDVGEMTVPQAKRIRHYLKENL